MKHKNLQNNQDEKDERKKQQTFEKTNDIYQCVQKDELFLRNHC
jgi:hypothetical protein